MTSNRYAMWCCSRLSCVRNRTGNGLSASSTSSGNRRCSCWIPRGRQCQIRPITPDLIGLCGSLFDEALTTPVKCQYGLLLSGFDRHEPHVRSSDGFTNSFSVCSIMLIGFNIGFDELRGHQFDIMAHRCISVYWPRNEQMHRPPCRSNRVGCWQKGGHLCPSELFVEQPFSVLVNPMDLENVFAKSIPIVLTFMIAALRSMSDDLSSHCGTRDGRRPFH
jgi:hypothetical protein